MIGIVVVIINHKRMKRVSSSSCSGSSTSSRAEVSEKRFLMPFRQLGVCGAATSPGAPGDTRGAAAITGLVGIRAARTNQRPARTARGAARPARPEALEAARPDAAAEAHRLVPGAEGPLALPVDRAVGEGARPCRAGGPAHGARPVRLAVHNLADISALSQQFRILFLQS